MIELLLSDHSRRGWQLRTDLAQALGCELRDDGSVAVDAAQATSVDRFYAAGNCVDPRALVPTRRARESRPPSPSMRA
jgi:thioredoxin reductase